MADLDELFRQADQAIANARPGKRGRNDACWCGSGRKYKRCHWESDQGVRALPRMATLLEEIAGPIPGEATLARAKAAVRLASVAWNATRRPDTWAALEDAAARLASEPGHRAVILRSLEAMSARAARWADDPRVVVRTEVVENATGGFSIHAVTALGAVD